MSHRGNLWGLDCFEQSPVLYLQAPFLESVRSLAKFLARDRIPGTDLAGGGLRGAQVSRRVDDVLKDWMQGYSQESSQSLSDDAIPSTSTSVTARWRQERIAVFNWDNEEQALSSSFFFSRLHTRGRRLCRQRGWAQIASRHLPPPEGASTRCSAGSTRCPANQRVRKSFRQVRLHAHHVHSLRQVLTAPRAGWAVRNDFIVNVAKAS